MHENLLQGHIDEHLAHISMLNLDWEQQMTLAIDFLAISVLELAHSSLSCGATLKREHCLQPEI